MIVSDISKREIIVDNEEEALSIMSQYKQEAKVHDVDVERVDLALFKIVIIYSVGDYFRKSKVDG